MSIQTPKRALAVLLIVQISQGLFAQAKVQYTDGRTDQYCTSTQQIISAKPKEVLFGIDIQRNGDVYFSMNNRAWFDKIFRNDSYGVAVDLISKSRYRCTVDPAPNPSVPKGTVIPAVYRKQLLQNAEELIKGSVYTKIGRVPPAMVGQEIEGNLMIVNGPEVCYYTNFVNIDRSLWQLLPMGFYTDTLLNQYTDTSTSGKDYFTYAKKLTIEIPFSKGSTTFNETLLKRYFDSLGLAASIIRKIEIRAYSSVEGPEAVNRQLMTKRAASMVAALQKFQPTLKRIHVISAENWLDFFHDIKGTPFEAFDGQPKLEIKKKLADPATLSSIETLLARHRKVVAILYTDNASPYSREKDADILNGFNKAIAQKEIARAQSILREIAGRVLDKRLPIEFMSRIEVPATKDYADILNDQAVYNLLLGGIAEYDALENLLEIKKLDPTNYKINYNICVLRFMLWHYENEIVSKKILKKEVDNLAKAPIPATLIKRMLINYYILKSEDQMAEYNYQGKDSSLNEIRNIYQKITPTDEEIYSLAKYYSYYSHMEWAEEIIAPRIASIDASENLVFYYLNLLFFYPSRYNSEEFQKASLNGINLNSKRFCHFFQPSDRGGASMQLLEHAVIKSYYCSACQQ